MPKVAERVTPRLSQNPGGTSYTSPQSLENRPKKSGTRVTRPSEHEVLRQCKPSGGQRIDPPCQKREGWARCLTSTIPTGLFLPTAPYPPSLVPSRYSQPKKVLFLIDQRPPSVAR